MLSYQTKKTLDRLLGASLQFLILLRRPRKLSVPTHGQITVMKIQGGGSLLLALPALLGIRNTYPKCHFTLIATGKTSDFGALSGVFDQIITLDDSSIAALLMTSARAFKQTVRPDLFINLEFRSRACKAWGSLLRSRFIFDFETAAGSAAGRSAARTLHFDEDFAHSENYGKLARTLGAEPATAQDCARRILGEQEPSSLVTSPQAQPAYAQNEFRVGLAPFCSDLCYERMLRNEQWIQIFKGELSAHPRVRLALFGNREEFSRAARLIQDLQLEFPHWTIQNLCGVKPLAEIAAAIALQNRVYATDSSLLHLARLLGVETVSFWGPSDPSKLLMPVKGLQERIYYQPPPCSPCVHRHRTAPCGGNNICMEQALKSHGDALKT